MHFNQKKVDFDQQKIYLNPKDTIFTRKVYFKPQMCILTRMVYLKPQKCVFLLKRCFQGCKGGLKAVNSCERVNCGKRGESGLMGYMGVNGVKFGLKRVNGG